MDTFYPDVPMHRCILIHFALFYALVSGVSKNDGLLTMQQGMCLRDIGDIGNIGDTASRANERMN